MGFRIIGSLCLLQVVALVCGQVNIADVDCPLPGGPSTSNSQECIKYPACTWSQNRCHMQPNSIAGYVVTSEPEDTGRGFKVNLRKFDAGITMFYRDILNLVFEVIYHEDYHVQIKIYDPSNSRYEVPIPLYLPDAAGTSPLYSVSTSSVGSPFSFSISRVSNGNSIFNSYGPLLFENQFIQITTTLASSYLYGLGENPHSTFRHQFTPGANGSITNPMFSRDQPPEPDEFNLYGVHPYYVNIEDDEGNTHSVLYYSSNAMEYSTFTLTNGMPALTLRSTGGIIDMHFFLGPTPENVNGQYVSAIGSSYLPPYWALGFHLSRSGYGTLENLKAVRQNMIDAEIPQDVQTFDSDYMDHNKDFTYDPVNWASLPEYIDQLHEEGVKVTFIMDAAIAIDPNYDAYADGRARDVFIKWMSPDLVPNDQIPEADNYIIGYVWPENKTVFPDFMNPETHSWWSDQSQILHETLHFDSLWIDMNEPSNIGTNLDRPYNYPEDLPDWSLKCPNSTIYDVPPYPTKASYEDQNESGRISDRTLCMSTLHFDGNNTYMHYDVHSLYGISQSVATFRALENIAPGMRHHVLSRSTFPGSGQVTAHWLGDNTANWEQMRMSIIGVLEFNLFGIAHVGADICGFLGNTTNELCGRWMQLGAFYPFSRNHNGATRDQDPGNPDLGIAVLSRDVLRLRYKYLPFLYSLFHRAYMHGSSVVRPLFNIFPTDVAARDVDDQFFWGSMLMIAPVLAEGAVTRDVYFPQGLWYNLVDGILASEGSETKNVDAPIDTIPVYVRGGSIVPFQEPEVTTTLSRVNPFGLTIALDESQEASGEIFWDDGESVHDMSQAFMSSLDFSNNVLNMTIMHGVDVVAGLNIETIQFYGYGSNPANITVGGNALDSSAWSFNATLSILSVYPSLPLNTEFSLELF